MSLTVIILAAGKGTRMKSVRPKVIHQLAGKAMLQHVIDTSRKLNPQQIMVVIGHESEQVRVTVQDDDVIWIEQTEQLGTGHAVMQCRDQLISGNDILVLYGDVPLISEQSLQQLLEKEHDGNVVTLLSFDAADPTGYGRIVRDDSGSVKEIREQKDASEEILQIKESNSGIMLIKGSEYQALLDELDNNNAQKEFYLTDVVKHAVAKSQQVDAVVCQDETEVLGVNNQQQLAEIESIYREQQASKLMLNGVKLVDPRRIDIRGRIEAGSDVVIDINCVLEGDVKLGDNVTIGPNCCLKNCSIGKNSEILANTVIEEAELGDNNSIGPFARVRPQTRTLNKAKIGNFVEIKKSIIGEGSKVNHLTYIGDTEMGSDVNIGAGTITCNYDGAFKHKTVIGNDVFVGSDTQLVAPVNVADGTTIGAGSTITKDTPEGELSLSRAKQVSIKGWERPRKTKG